MFKELKVIKLLIVISLLTGIIFKIDFPDLAIQGLYTNQLSYNPGDTAKIYCSSKAILPFSLNVNLTDISGKSKATIELPIIMQESSSPNILKNGLGYKNFTNFIIPSNLKSGIYLINKKYPLIIKSKEKTDITVVYPFMNNILYKAINHKNVFSDNTPSASFKRTCEIDTYTKGMSKFFSYLDANYPVNYITDIDLESSININNSKLLLIYGKSTCWTPKMKNSLVQYLDNGGNLLNITSYFANNICWKEKEAEIVLVDSTQKINSWQTYNSLTPIPISGSTYSYSGYSDNKKYKIKEINHPIFKGVSETEIKIDAHLFVAPPVKWDNSKPNINLDLMKYYDGEILAYSDAYYKNFKGTKGIYITQPDSTSGKIVSLGTEDWCLTKNIGEKKQLQIITKNAVDFLLR